VTGAGRGGAGREGEPGEGLAEASEVTGIAGIGGAGRKAAEHGGRRRWVYIGKLIAARVVRLGEERGWLGWRVVGRSCSLMESSRGGPSAGKFGRRPSSGEER